MANWLQRRPTSYKDSDRLHFPLIIIICREMMSCVCIGVQNPDVFMTLVQTYLCAMYG